MTITSIGGISVNDLMNRDEPMPYRAEKWYDRGARCWIVVTRDREGNQIGDADLIVGQKAAHDALVARNTAIAKANDVGLQAREALAALVAWVDATGICSQPAFAGMNIEPLQRARAIVEGQS